jgi:hypothetical protein
MADTIARIVDGRLEFARFGARDQLASFMQELKTAYAERAETGYYSAAKERRDLKEAFIDRCLAEGMKRGEAKRMFERLW